MALLATALLAAYLQAANTLLWHQLQRKMVLSAPGQVPNDLVVPWMGARALVRGENPYGDEFARRLHLAIYGAVVQPSEAMPNVAAFSYPAYVVVALGPLLLMPFWLVQPLSVACLALALAAAAGLWRDLLPLPASRRGRWAAAGGALCFFPSLEILWLQQPSGLVLLLLAAAIWLAARQRVVLAGALLALAMLKPQTAALPAAGLLCWSLWRPERRGLLAGFGTVMAAQLMLAEWLLPGWLWSFLAANARYQQLNQSLYWLPQKLAGSTVAGAACVAAPLLAWTAWLWWRARHETAGSPAVLHAFAATLAAAVILAPDVSFYNRAALVLPILLILCGPGAAGLLGRAGHRLAQAAVVAPAALLATAAVTSWLGVPGTQPLLDWAEALYLVLPVLLLPALVWPTRAARPETSPAIRPVLPHPLTGAAAVL